jgi:hypothetical protein
VNTQRPGGESRSWYENPSVRKDCAGSSPAARTISLALSIDKKSAVAMIERLQGDNPPSVYTADDPAEQIIIVAIQHPAREREHADA